jgi:glycosyltransferase involved in cell wall biosynthesis
LFFEKKQQKTFTSSGSPASQHPGSTGIKSFFGGFFSKKEDSLLNPGPSRILIISDQSVARGGAEAMAVASAIALARAGNIVSFFCGDEGESPALREAGVEVVAVCGAHVRQSPRAAALFNGLYFARSRRILAGWIAAHDDPRVIYHVHSWSKILSPSIFDALTTVQHRVVIHAHDFFMICPNGGFTNYQTHEGCDLAPMSGACLRSNCDKRSYAEKLWRVGRQRIRAHYFDTATAPASYLLVHRGMLNFFLAAGVPPQRLQVLHNPVAAPALARMPAELNDTICFIGRLDPEKGALDAARAAREAGVKLRIIGDGIERAAITAANPNAEITGWCTPDEVNTQLATARLLVVPSRWRETFGMAVVEALRMGIPVLISDTALIARDVVEFQAGLAIDTKNIPLFAATLSRLASDDAAIKSMSEQAMYAAASLALREDEWRDALLTHYRAVLGD